MIGTDYMNDNAIHSIYPVTKDKNEIAIEILNECLDDISDEISYQAGIKINSDLYVKIRQMIYKAREQINKL